MTKLARLLAVLEVSIVAFVLVPCLTLGLYRLFPSLEAWQTEGSAFRSRSLLT